MARRRSAAELLDAADSAGTAIQAKDREAEAKAELEQSRPSVLPLGKILDRTSDTRELSNQHVSDLAESIAVLGLLEPLVVDRRGRLLAGGHRKAAVFVLKEADPTAYAKQFSNDLVPVRVVDFDAEENPDLALQVEVTENEKRRDYTPGEVRALAERLRDSGYADVKGRPAKGEKALRPALEVIIGKSIRTVRRYLNTDIEESVTDVRLSGTEDSNTVATSLRRLQTELTRWQKAYAEPGTPELESITKNVTRLLKRVDTALKKEKG
ncbi:chromosome partitioning protein ParB [Phormidesmis priestleyi ULC007]|uniref:Chromosome partitioning protein ParB n=1 Tax=Phormidesmis priestleyi ULC007 TaxID=1920490 RepID=A0A2T1D2K2_9CYAN|nr:ParB/RepB/Spo0J family partition protein [Phormidesmis priestleyi]PSB14733.1 chromosome partitioning protein ParB [Phormidesmis priestleyi ULC007]